MVGVNLWLERIGVLLLELLLLLWLLLLMEGRRVEVDVVERIPCGIFLYLMSLDYIVFATRNVESKTLEKYDTLLWERTKTCC